MLLTGHCLCKAVTYTAEVDTPIVGYDHCDDCQRQTGSTYSLVCLVPEENFKPEGLPLKKWKGTGKSGKPVWRTFCPECGSPISHEPEVSSVIAIKCGTLDTDIKRALKPEMEIWTDSKLPFCQEKLPKQFTQNPAPPA